MEILYFDVSLKLRC